MAKLRVKRFIQEPSTCAIAASASIGNYYNNKINFDKNKKVAQSLFSDISEGLWSQETGLLLNNMGFGKVTIVSSDLEYLDYSWNNISRRKLINRFKKIDEHVSEGYFGIGEKSIDFLQKSKNNMIIVDHEFKKYIKSSIDNSRPVLTNYNWDLLHRYPNTIKNGYSHHAVVAHGYDEKKIYLIDSHISHYKKHLSKYFNGRYSFKWDIFLTGLGVGDVILAEDYNKENAHEYFK